MVKVEELSIGELLVDKFGNLFEVTGINNQNIGDRPARVKMLYRQTSAPHVYWSPAHIDPNAAFGVSNEYWVYRAMHDALRGSGVRATSMEITTLEGLSKAKIVPAEGVEGADGADNTSVNGVISVYSLQTGDILRHPGTGARFEVLENCAKVGNSIQLKLTHMGSQILSADTLHKFDYVGAERWVLDGYRSQEIREQFPAYEVAGTDLVLVRGNSEYNITMK